MIERVFSTIKKHNLIDKGESVIVGVSGGADSICLLHILYSLRNRLGIKLFAVHINHMLRGSEADADEDYVREFCKSLGIDLYTESINIREIAAINAVSVEEAGREARYEQFAKYAKRLGASKIAVAHNKNDQSETVLMNIIRGTGLDGLKGIEYKRGAIIRPLMDIERKEIESYCSMNALNPRVDSSNLKNIYTRNKIRLELIPYIDKLFEAGISDKLYKLSLMIKDDLDYIGNSADILYSRCLVKSEDEEIGLNLDLLKNQHIALIKRVLRTAVKKVKGDLKGVESKHVESVVNLIMNGRTGSTVCLTDKIRAEKSYDILRIYKPGHEDTHEYFEMMIEIPGTNYIESLKSYITADIVEKNSESTKCFENNCKSSVQFFDYEKLKTGIYIRYRKEGDLFKPYKSNGTKKLKEYFIDNKIPRNLRETIPLVAKDKDIVWIIGYKISDKFKVTENTKYILKLECKKQW
jgi:tRNA(Ile)-lysidine synthase